MELVEKLRLREVSLSIALQTITNCYAMHDKVLSPEAVLNYASKFYDYLVSDVDPVD